ncbi:hypothetical protein L392_00693 [Klebsiella pneumoniae MGH 46]|nr:hypothetical protein L392_00693 [Klebsiella pneumoniae MGH 46]
MQTAQKVITAYRHKRIIVCLLVALATLSATLAIRFISQRSVNEEYSHGRQPTGGGAQ